MELTDWLPCSCHSFPQWHWVYTCKTQWYDCKLQLQCHNHYKHILHSSLQQLHHHSNHSNSGHTGLLLQYWYIWDTLLSGSHNFHWHCNQYYHCNHTSYNSHQDQKGHHRNHQHTCCTSVQHILLYKCKWGHWQNSGSIQLQSCLTLFLGGIHIYCSPVGCLWWHHHRNQVHRLHSLALKHKPEKLFASLKILKGISD